LSDEPLRPASVDEEETPGGRTRRPPPGELLATEGALMLRTDFVKLGLPYKAVDVIFRECPVIELPGFSRPMVRAEAARALLEGCTYCDRCGDRVRPCGVRGLR
jgi:hypothetical protein